MKFGLIFSKAITVPKLHLWGFQVLHTRVRCNKDTTTCGVRVYTQQDSANSFIWSLSNYFSREVKGNHSRVDKTNTQSNHIITIVGNRDILRDFSETNKSSWKASGQFVVHCSLPDQCSCMFRYIQRFLYMLILFYSSHQNWRPVTSSILTGESSSLLKLLSPGSFSCFY